MRVKMLFWSSHQRFSMEQVFLKIRKIHKLKSVAESLFWWSCWSKACSSIKRRLWHRCFPVKLAKFLRTLFLHNVSLRLLLAVLKIGKTCVFITTNVYFRNILLKRLSVAKTLSETGIMEGRRVTAQISTIFLTKFFLLRYKSSEYD